MTLSPLSTLGWRCDCDYCVCRILVVNSGSDCDYIRISAVPISLGRRCPARSLIKHNYTNVIDGGCAVLCLINYLHAILCPYPRGRPFIVGKSPDKGHLNYSCSRSLSWLSQSPILQLILVGSSHSFGQCLALIQLYCFRCCCWHSPQRLYWITYWTLMNGEYVWLLCTTMESVINHRSNLSSRLTAVSFRQYRYLVPETAVGNIYTRWPGQWITLDPHNVRTYAAVQLYCWRVAIATALLRIANSSNFLLFDDEIDHQKLYNVRAVTTLSVHAAVSSTWLGGTVCRGQVVIHSPSICILSTVARSYTFCRFSRKLMRILDNPHCPKDHYTVNTTLTPCRWFLASDRAPNSDK